VVTMTNGTKCRLEILWIMALPAAAAEEEEDVEESSEARPSREVRLDLGPPVTAASAATRRSSSGRQLTPLPPPPPPRPLSAMLPSALSAVSGAPRNSPGPSLSATDELVRVGS
jgi:hypothetical protein